MSMIKEFREFAIKGNVFDMAIGVIMGGAFGKLISSLIEDVLMPMIGKVAGTVDFSQYKFVLTTGVAAVTEVKDAAGKVTTAAVAPVAEVAVRFGSFATVIINFLILAFVVFLMVKAFNTAKKRFEDEKPAPAPAPAGPSEKDYLKDIRDLLSRK